MAIAQKRQGVFTVISAVAIQLTLGIAYIWSVFQTGIALRLFDGNHASAALCFSLLLAMVPIGMGVGGKLAIRYSPRLVVFLGGIIFSLGFFLSSFVTPNHAWLIWITYGVISGFGNGFAYTTTIACAQKWYPHKKGLVTGIIIFGFGFGGVIFTPLVERLIRTFGGVGVGEARTFLILSGICLVVCVTGSFFQVNPPEGYGMEKTSANPAAAKATVNYSPKEMFKMPLFYLTVASFLLACMGGLMMIGFTRPIAVARGLAATASLGVIAIAMFNSLGRLFWGWVSDRIGRTNTLVLLLGGTAVLSLFVGVVSGYWIYLIIALIGFCFGGILCSYPPLTAELFGPKFLAANYGFVMLGFSAGAIISSQIGGYFKNLAAYDISRMFPAFVITSICATAAIGMILVMKGIMKRQNAG